jgi:hypothetical protein
MSPFPPQVLAEYVNGSLSKTYTIGDDIIAEHTAGGSRYLMYDGQGSTRQLVDDSGAIINEHRNRQG